MQSDLGIVGLGGEVSMVFDIDAVFAALAIIDEGFAYPACFERCQHFWVNTADLAHGHLALSQGKPSAVLGEFFIDGDGAQIAQAGGFTFVADLKRRLDLCLPSYVKIRSSGTRTRK